MGRYAELISEMPLRNLLKEFCDLYYAVQRNALMGEINPDPTIETFDLLSFNCVKNEMQRRGLTLTKWKKMACKGTLRSHLESMAF